LIIFPLTVLAGFGTQALLEKGDPILRKGRKTTLILLLLLFLVAGIGIFLYLYQVVIPSLVSQGQKIDAWKELRTGFLWFLCFWGVSFLAVFGLHRYPTALPPQVVLVLVIALDLMLLGRIDGGYLREDQSRISPSAPNGAGNSPKGSSTLPGQQFPGFDESPLYLQGGGGRL
jgi:hypothetical protein